MKTVRIELKVNFNDRTKFETLKTAVRRAARELMTTAQLISDGRTPAIAIEIEGLFDGAENVSLEDPDEGGAFERID